MKRLQKMVSEGLKGVSGEMAQDWASAKPLSAVGVG